MDIRKRLQQKLVDKIQKGQIASKKRTYDQTDLEDETDLNALTSKYETDDDKPIIQHKLTPENLTNGLYSSCPETPESDTDKAGILGKFHEKQPILAIGSTACGKTSWILNIVIQHMFDHLFDFAHICCQSPDHPAYATIKSKIEKDGGQCNIHTGIEESLLTQYANQDAYNDKHFLFIIDDLDQNMSKKENQDIINILNTTVNVFHSKINSTVIITTHDPFTQNWAAVKKGCKVFVLFFSNENASALRQFLQQLYRQNAELVNSIMRHMENDRESTSPGIIIKNPPRELRSSFYTLDGVKLDFPTK